MFSALPLELGHCSTPPARLKRAKSGSEHTHEIISSARASGGEMWSGQFAKD
jgi:hypothetical protein